MLVHNGKSNFVATKGTGACYGPSLRTSSKIVGINRLVGWLVVLGFNATLTTKVMSWRSVTHMCFPCFLTPVLTQLFFPKPPTTFLTCFCRGQRRKYAAKKVRLNRGSNSQPPGRESDTLTTEPPGRVCELIEKELDI